MGMELVIHFMQHKIWVGGVSGEKCVRSDETILRMIC